jgi:simple sugar transport system ATP-binding protein
MMVGRDLTRAHKPVPRTPGGVRFSVSDLTGPGFGSLTLDVRGGEILGVAGVDGNGQIELTDTLAGLRRAHAGRIVLDGRDITHAPVAARVQAGLAYIPADRASTALVRGMSVAENLMLRDSGNSPYARGPFLTPFPAATKARKLMAEYDIRAAGPSAVVMRLSGGNQQKIVVARELDRAPAVLVAHQAAWGLDPGATRFVLDQVIALRDAGAAVVYVSSELEEVLEISDRIAVMAGGQFAGEMPTAEADLKQIGLWMAGRPE